MCIIINGVIIEKKHTKLACGVLYIMCVLCVCVSVGLTKLYRMLHKIKLDCAGIGSFIHIYRNNNDAYILLNGKHISLKNIGLLNCKNVRNITKLLKLDMFYRSCSSA